MPGPHSEVWGSRFIIENVGHIDFMLVCVVYMYWDVACFVQKLVLCKLPNAQYISNLDFALYNMHIIINHNRRQWVLQHAKTLVEYKSKMQLCNINETVSQKYWSLYLPLNSRTVIALTVHWKLVEKNLSVHTAILCTYWFQHVILLLYCLLSHYKFVISGHGFLSTWVHVVEYFWERGFS